MKVILGIDFGGSTIKIVGFCGKNKIGQLRVKSEDKLVSFYGSIGKFLHNYNISIDNVESIILTGVGGSFINENVYNIKIHKVDEISSIGYGGLYLSHKDSAIVVSMGTGTAYVHAIKDKVTHIGGTAIGGGTLIGLSKLILNTTNIDTIKEYINEGCISNVDLTLKDICNEKISFLDPDTTVSNLGNITSNSNKSDISVGIINMIYQSIATNAVFYSKVSEVNEIVLVGGLTKFPYINESLNKFKKLYNTDFIIPDDAVFSTAIGAVIYYNRNIRHN